MKKHTYIGTNSDASKFCILKSHVDFNTLYNNIKDIESSDFVHECKDLGGCYSITKFNEIMKADLINPPIKLINPITFSGYDNNCTFVSSWNFTVYLIYRIIDTSGFVRVNGGEL